MVSIKWCLNKKNGLELVQPNPNLCQSYLSMGEESLKVMEKVQESQIWTATTTYYIFYYSLYAVMMHLGVKCEIHSCSLEFMKHFLNQFYSPEDFQMIQAAFLARNDLQYYANRPVNARMVEENKRYCRDFYIKSKDIISRITEVQIEGIRKGLRLKISRNS
ncbi:MAG TPA: hypothetical protein VJA23_04450 [Candidatus Nanoarchaeia archaeon]|nr:hypothetical protein [Candidatus Nanoarchaeia archaeon]